MGVHFDARPLEAPPLEYPYFPDKKYKKPSIVARIGYSFHFLLVIRVISLILSLCAVFTCAFSDHWMEKTPAVFGMVFSVLSAVVISAAIAVLFVWELPFMTLPKRSLFVVIFCLTSLVAGVLYSISISLCTSFSRLGCFYSSQSPALRVSAAFSFVSVICSVVDCVIQFFFYRTDPKPTRNISDISYINTPRVLPSRHTEV